MAGHAPFSQTRGFVEHLALWSWFYTFQRSAYNFNKKQTNNSKNLCSYAIGQSSLVNWLSDGFSGLRSLSRLYLSCLEKLDENNLSAFVNMPALNELHLSFNSLSVTGLCNLMSCPVLAHVDLTGCPSLSIPALFGYSCSDLEQDVPYTASFDASDTVLSQRIVDLKQWLKYRIKLTAFGTRRVHYCL